MAQSHPNSIALLIDADNAPATKIEFILSELAAHGVVNIRRAYGNWTKSDLGGWIKVLHDNSIQPMQSFDLVKGKNATDMALCIAKAGGKKLPPKVTAPLPIDDDYYIPF